MFQKKVAPLAAILVTFTAAGALAAVDSDSAAGVSDESLRADINLRTFYMNRNFSGDTDSREALTQALRFDLEKDLSRSFTIGASLFANAKIMDGTDAHLTGLLDSEDGDGYAKLGQIFAEYNYNDALFIKGGRWVMDTALLSDSDSRATPSSTQAIQVTGKYDMGQVYVIYSDRASSKTESEFTRYTDANGDKYGIVIVGGDVKFENGLSFAAAYGDADGYAEQLYLNGGYQVTDNLFLGVTHYIGEGDGANAAFDANLTNIVVSYTVDKLKLSTGIQTVSGDSGYDYMWGGDDDNSLLTSNSVQILDFNRLDEDSLQVRADYDFANIFPGFKMMARHTMGEYTESNEEVDEAETNFELMYTVAESGTMFDGLNLRMRYSHIEADAYENIDEIRLIANYNFNMF